jgi:hypothetical protein
MNLRENIAQRRKEYLARLREQQLEHLACLCQNLSRAAASVGEILDLCGEALSARVCGALLDALAGLVMAELHIYNQAEQQKGDRA